ncbi:MAG: response regulator [Rhodospirillaceae bacterium]|nr:response regulator [Rhodospirillaceae bacterium]
MTTVLIVDDTPAVRQLALSMLEKLGFDGATADRGETALHMCRRQLPDAILLDWNMPGMDGPAFQRALRALHGGADVKVIFCTVKSDLEHMQIALAGGACEFIMKPFDLEILASKLQMAGLLAVADAA